MGDQISNRGILRASAEGNTVVWQGTTNRTFKRPFNDTYYHMEIGGTAIKTMPSDLILLGDLNITSTLNTNNRNLTLYGDWTNTGAFTEGTGNVTFTGSFDQIITNAAGETFNDLTITKSGSDLILAGDVIVSSDLVMNSGNLVTGTSLITLGTGTGNTGTLTHSDGTIVGRMERWISATGTNILFPIGTDDYYRPGLITFHRSDGRVTHLRIS